MRVLTERMPFADRVVRSMLDIVDTETGQVETVYTVDHCIEAPNWTQDGRYLIFNGQGLLHAYDLDAGKVLPVQTGFAARCNNDHVLSPDGRQIAISHNTVEDGLSRIYTLPLCIGEGTVSPRLITPIAPSYLHGWSPDGQLAYCAERNGAYDIHVIDVQGGEERRLTEGHGLADGPEYTPDGAYLWYNTVRSGLMQLWRMRPDGSQQEQMTDDARNNWFAHLSPDGRQVAYVSYRTDEVQPPEHPPNKHVEIRLMPAEGGTPRTLVSLFGGQGTMNVNAWAPDSRRLAYVRYALLENAEG